MQGYQTTLGQGLRQEGYRKSGSLKRAPDQEGVAANSPSGFARTNSNGSSGLARAGSSSPAGFARASSNSSNLYQDTDRIAAVRPSGREEAEAQGLPQAEPAMEPAAAAPAVARRQRSLMQKSKLTTRPSVADRLKNVRGMLDAADEAGGDEIQEELPTAPVAAVQGNDGTGLDEPIAEEPQLAGN